jgi:hypothetical protein
LLQIPSYHATILPCQSAKRKSRIPCACTYEVNGFYGAFS